MANWYLCVTLGRLGLGYRQIPKTRKTMECKMTTVCFFAYSLCLLRLAGDSVTLVRIPRWRESPSPWLRERRKGAKHMPSGCDVSRPLTFFGQA